MPWSRSTGKCHCVRGTVTQAWPSAAFGCGTPQGDGAEGLESTPLERPAGSTLEQLSQVCNVSELRHQVKGREI